MFFPWNRNKPKKPKEPEQVVYQAVTTGGKIVGGKENKVAPLKPPYEIGTVLYEAPPFATLLAKGGKIDKMDYTFVMGERTPIHIREKYLVKDEPGWTIRFRTKWRDALLAARTQITERSRECSLRIQAELNRINESERSK